MVLRLLIFLKSPKFNDQEGFCYGCTLAGVLKQSYSYSFYQYYISTLNYNRFFGYSNLFKWLLGSLHGNIVKTNQRVVKSGKINTTFIS